MKIAVSGSYSVGKTSTVLALSFLTGLPKTHARTMREILPTTFPGKRLENCLPNELMELGMRRFFERCEAEQKLGNSFISDGCSLQEWIYGTARLSKGLNPNEKQWKVWLNKRTQKYRYDVFSECLNSFGQLVTHHAKTAYDLFIHLPIEFPFEEDGHRPVKESFRTQAEKIILQAYQKIDIPVLEVRGDMSQRLNKIVNHLKLPRIMSVENAISLAEGAKLNEFDKVKLEYQNNK